MKHRIQTLLPRSSILTLSALFAVTACSAGTPVSSPEDTLLGEDGGTGTSADGGPESPFDAGVTSKDGAVGDAALVDPTIEFDLKIDGTSPTIAKFKVERKSPTKFELVADFDTTMPMGGKKNLWFTVTISDAAAGTADCNYAGNPDVSFNFSSMKNGTQSFLSATTCSRTISRSATTGFTVGSASGVMVSGAESATFIVKWAQKTPP